jgi:hypothetical protein
VPSWSIDLVLYDTNKAELTTGNSAGYTRLNVLCGTATNWTLGTDKLTLTNAVAFTFAAATGAWTQAVYCGFYLHGGGTIQYGPVTALQTPVSVLNGNQISFGIGAFVITQSLR